MSNPPFKRLWPLFACALLLVTILLWWQSRPATAPKSAPSTNRPTEKAAAPAPVAVTPPAQSAGPEVRLNAALRIPDPRQRAQEFGMLLIQWIQSDLDAALAYVRQMPRGNEYSQGLFMVLDA